MSLCVVILLSRLDDISTVVSPTYTITRYTDQIYKIVKFKREFTSYKVGARRGSPVRSEKTEPSLSRSRKLVFEKALCNPWDWFGTFTVAPNKLDRYDLDSFYKKFSKFIENESSRHGKVKYLLIPEQHEDGAWHCHGFLSGNLRISRFRDLAQQGLPLPYTLLKNDYYRWDPYDKSFGFCSLGRLRYPVASAFYISKYMTKDACKLVSSFGSRLFWASHGLNSALKFGDVYGNSRLLDDLCTQDYDYCRVGMTRVDSGLTWADFCSLMDHVDVLPMFEPLIPDHCPGDFFDDLAAINYEQQSLF